MFCLTLKLEIMTNLCLENYGVSKLETQEMRAINGGMLAALIGGFFLGMYVYSLIFDK